MKDPSNNYNPLSANTLFHFTRNIDNLTGILKNGFKPKYCLEDLSMFGLSEVAIPMTCFCDIPLSQIRNHISTYGHYAIGLSKDWGMNNRISPIMYTYSDSESTKMLNENLIMLHRGETDKIHKYIIDAVNDTNKNNPTALLVESISRQSAFLAYTKQYEGQFWRNGRYLDHPVRFYDEREWRFVPQFENCILNQVKNSIDKEHFLDSGFLDEENRKLQQSFVLDFTPDDIKYIVVSSEVEVLSMARKVEEIKSKFSFDQKEVVKTRIISMEQILEDF